MPWRFLLLVTLAACGGTAANTIPSDSPTTVLTPAAHASNAQSRAAADAGSVPGAPDAGVAGTVTIVDNVVGDGPAAKAGDHVRVHYTGTLLDGTVFDTSRKKGRPLEFHLGAGSVIAGFEQGIAGMKSGGRRTLTIPPDLAFGSRGRGHVVPPNAVVVIDVELLSLQ